MEAVSTNGDIFTVKADGSRQRRRAITTNPAFDGAPAYSPDGKWLAYRAQSRPGNEADQWRLMKYDRQATTHVAVTTGFDRSVNQLAWTPDSQTIYFNGEDSGYLPVFRVAAAGGTPGVVTPATFAAEYALSADGRTLVLARSSQQGPAELVALSATGGDIRALTSHNAERLVAARPAEGRALHVRRRRRHQRPRDAAEAAVVRSFEEIPGADGPARRTGNAVRRHVERPVEQADAGRTWLRGADDQPARVHGLRPAVHRRHQQRLGRQGVRGPDEGPRRRRWRSTRFSTARAWPPPARRTAAT